ncbi:hypothetical protein [Kutzneria sp. CA-103260]|uniref:hypothetical protein n=1 Tax=Kutzneria sp. CA-103260 TaxID=2802641 RepID=UPI001BA79845|nr:hypothetical protein [Kutzneria sp. CA-103260]QUQ71340.1 Protein translocase subunit SecD [Kutzneria sp. CA-103260]
MYLLAQALLDGKSIDHAGYQHVSGDEWNLILTFTPEGLKTWTAYCTSHPSELALVVDGHVQVNIPVTNTMDHDIKVFCTGQQARDLAAMINNH